MSGPTLLIVDQRHNIISCAVHEYALLPSQVLSHLNKHHTQDTTPEERKELLEEVERCRSKMSLKEQYEDFTISDSPIPAVQGLRVHLSSHQCSTCGLIYAGDNARHNMLAHLRQEHSMYASELSDPHERQAWYKNQATIITSQRYFPTVPKEHSRLMQHFAVIGEDNKSTEDSPDTSPAAVVDEKNTLFSISSIPGTTEQGSTSRTTSKAEALGDNVVEAREARAARLRRQLQSATAWVSDDRAKRLASVPALPSVSTNPWIAHTRFLEVLQGLNWKEALLYVQPPYENHGPLYVLYGTVRGMVRTWQNITVRSTRSSRIWVMREDDHDIPFRPLEPYQHLNTKHAITLQKVFLFFYRVFVEGLATPVTLHVTPPQCEAWNKVQQYLAECIRVDQYPEVGWDHGRTELTPLERLCHQFWLTLVEQTEIGDDFHLSLITPLAFIAISPKGDNFREAYLFATDLSALKKFARMAGLERVYEASRKAGVDKCAAVEDVVASPVTSEEVQLLLSKQESALTTDNLHEQHNRNKTDELIRWVRNYLSTSYPTPMCWIIHTSRYLSRYRYGDTLDAFVQWNGDVVCVRQVRTTMDKFRSMVWNTYEEASTMLCRLLCVERRSDLPQIPWESLIEDPLNKSIGWSVFSPSNPVLAQDASFLGESMIKATVENKFRNTVVSDLADNKQVQRWIALLHAFLGQLLVLCHCVGGGVPRGTEGLSVYIENSVEGGLRNVFLFQGLVALVPRYHKGYHQDKTLKTIHRFLPREIGSLLVWYLWLVRPYYASFLHNVAAHIRERHYAQATSSLLWPDRDGKQRHTSELLGQVLRAASSRWMNVEINLSTMRHLIIAFERKLATKDGLPAELTREEVEEILDEAEAESREMQSGHSAETAHGIYALNIQNMFSRNYNRPEKHFRSSTKWHVALGFETIIKEESLTWKQEGDDLYRQRVSTRRSANVQLLLEENLGKGACFRGLQAEALRAVLIGTPVVAYIAGTGVGKSILFLLPACYPEYGVTIVIVPLAALRSDLLERSIPSGPN
ncbi:hypothetical protein PTNB73_07009 [Pyrenophora teres f. teres]|nr:hypothetical protein PTNB73_07009 [Pyrenophora teres f. teres]